ncbi:SMI1/KNR4 family protein [Nonomuraea sp. KM90]|uniref:SMI1/KNR4 family protein n=1 Tax=Nonomuraea sp. KM90 TaxID=3457428 RepID=UPI003FCE07C2
MNATWRRTERWLARHAPATYKSLRPPATPQAIARAEAAMGAHLPDDLRASLLRHDGARDGGFSFPPIYTAMSIRGIQHDWQGNCDITLDDPQLSPHWWHGRLIPFGYDGTGGSLFVDPDTGRTGSWHNEDGLHTDDGRLALLPGPAQGQRPRPGTRRAGARLASPRAEGPLGLAPSGVNGACRNAQVAWRRVRRPRAARPPTVATWESSR